LRLEMIRIRNKKLKMKENTPIILSMSVSCSNAVQCNSNIILHKNIHLSQINKKMLSPNLTLKFTNSYIQNCIKLYFK